MEGCGLCREQGGLGSLVTRLLDKFEPRFAPPSAVLINSSVSFSLSFSFLSPPLQAAIVSTSFSGHYTLCRSSNHADRCHVACARSHHPRTPLRSRRPVHKASMEPLEQVTSNESTASVELGDYLFCAHCGLEQCKSTQCDFRQSVCPFPQQLFPALASCRRHRSARIELTISSHVFHAAQVKTTRSPVRARLPARSTLDLLSQRLGRWGLVPSRRADLAAALDPLFDS